MQETRVKYLRELNELIWKTKFAAKKSNNVVGIPFAVPLDLRDSRLTTSVDELCRTTLWTLSVFASDSAIACRGGSATTRHSIIPIHWYPVNHKIVLVRWD